MNNNTILFKKISTCEVIKLIASAKKRIIFTKPAFLKEEIEALISATDEGIAVTIYMEEGDSAIRYSFGDKEALELINKNLDKININLANKIRIAILVVDDNTAIYTPNLASIDEESSDLTFPNGFLCNSEVTEDIVSQYLPENKEDKSSQKFDNIVIFPGGYIPVSNEEEIIENINSTIETLTINPAIDPAKLRRVNIYRNNYKILKIQINGIRIRNKKVSLKSFNSFLPRYDKRLVSSWEIFTLEDVNNLQSTKLFEKELGKLKDKYKESLFDAGRFGYIIDINNKKEFTDELDNLRVEYKEYFIGDASDKIIKRFESNKDGNNEDDKTNIKKVIEDSHSNLIKHLISLCPEDDEFTTKIFGVYRHLKEEYSKEKDKSKIIYQFIKLFVANELRFPDVDEMAESIDIKCDCYDISDELLSNDDFNEVINNYNLEFRKNTSGFETANA